MPTIEERFLIHVSFSPIHLGYLITILLGEEIYLHNYLIPEYVCRRDKIHPANWAREWLREHVLKEWPTCDQTSTSELQYRKTIISSCGQLKVIESL
ncbi:DNA repair protein [Escherichia phage LL11]|uniref:DNA repair protein n=1 Tax=Escherichia phage LL11 TaxID=2315628 RepID=A0A385IPY1_9CAUD|nr:DNA repair protein [Escherichia phage LL11]AXY85394.1 DNA repair protein [Escherichia phage LL11]